MITLDALRQALLSSDPNGELDCLVRAELASGGRTEQIYEVLLSLVLPVRGTPGYTDSAEDALMDTLDALSGYVHPSSAYRDPPAGNVPENGRTIQIQATVLPGGRVEVVSPALPVGRSVSVTITVPISAES